MGLAAVSVLCLYHATKLAAGCNIDVNVSITDQIQLNFIAIHYHGEDKNAFSYNVIKKS